MIRTMNLFTKAVLDSPTLWLGKFNSVWQAFWTREVSRAQNCNAR
jgi:hypothetical protein